MKREVEGELNEAVHQTFRAHSEAAAEDLRAAARRAARKLAGKFAKKVRNIEKIKPGGRNR